MIYIAVIEDNIEDLNLLKSTLKAFFQEKNKAYCLIHYSDAASFLFDYKSQFHLIFMDIDLPGLDGMSAAKIVRESDSMVALVFLTNLSHYAINGYEVNALDYLLKPINPYSFSLKMPKVLHQIELNSDKEISVITKSMIQRFSTSEIYYVEIISHQLYYHTELGVFNTRGSLLEASAMLAPYHFRRCNNCYLVNLKHVSGIKNNNVFVGPDTLSISRSKKTAFIHELTNYLGGQL